YYGDEIGMTGANDPDCRKCMVWEAEKQDRELHQFVKDLIALRRNEAKTLSEGSVHWLATETASGTIIFERTLNNRTIRGIFNTGMEAITTELIGENVLSNGVTSKNNAITIEPKGFIITVK